MYSRFKDGGMTFFLTIHLSMLQLRTTMGPACRCFAFSKYRISANRHIFDVACFLAEVHAYADYLLTV